jgi:O-antigen ligase
MEQSFEFGSIAQPRRWMRSIPAAGIEEQPKTSFTLLVVFLLILYSSIAVWYKPLEVLRPALVVALAALVMLVIELGQTGQRFKLSRPQGVLLFAFLAVCFVASFDAFWPHLAFDRTADVIKIVLIFVVIENTITTESRLRTVLMTMALGGLFPSLGTIYYFLHGFLKEGRATWIGVFANANEDAYALVILMPIAAVLAARARLGVRLLLWGAIATYLLAIFLTYSRGGFVGLFAVLCLAGWKQKSPLTRSVMIGGVIGSLVLVSLYWGRSAGFSDISKDTTYNQRIATIEAGLLMFQANPLFGVGPGCSIVAYPIYVPEASHCGCQMQLVVHNTFVQVLSEVGILGFIPFMLFLGLSLFKAWTLQKGPLGEYAAALEVALWGFVVCSLAGGFTYTWWPYIVIGLIVAAGRIADSTAVESAHAGI